MPQHAKKKTKTVRPLIRRPSAVIFDFDGVFTDNKVYVFDDGREAVACNRSDGLGIGLLHRTGLPLLVLSAEKNPVVAARCRKLTLECIQGVKDKLPALQKWLADRKLNIQHAVYVGNDVNDLECMAAVGFPIAVADAYPQIKAVAKLVLKAPGGNGAVREVCDLVITTLTPASGKEAL